MNNADYCTNTTKSIINAEIVVTRFYEENLFTTSVETEINIVVKAKISLVCNAE